MKDFLKLLKQRMKRGFLSSKVETDLALSEIAQPITPVSGWDELVASEAERKLIRHVIEEVKRRYKRFGFLAKVIGKKATLVQLAADSAGDRSMTSEILATELGIPLYRIDCSFVLNKYIGETEKNLNALLDQAKNRRVILFFDEADALFGRRSEVTDAHDRYANIEVSHLLNRIEKINGLAILATNLTAELEDDCIQKMKCVIKLEKKDDE